MTTPIVIEIPRALEPIAHDTFLGELPLSVAVGRAAGHVALAEAEENRAQIPETGRRLRVPLDFLRALRSPRVA